MVQASQKGLYNNINGGKNEKSTDKDEVSSNPQINPENIEETTQDEQNIDPLVSPQKQEIDEQITPLSNPIAIKPGTRVIVKEVIKEVFDQKRFDEKIKKRALSLLVQANTAKKQKHESRIQEIYDYIKLHGPVSNQSIQKRFKLSPMTIWRYTKKLTREGRISAKGARRNRVYSKT